MIHLEERGAQLNRVYILLFVRKEIKDNNYVRIIPKR